MALWDSPRQRDAYAWFDAELANLRTAFRWAADSGEIDSAVTITTYAAILGIMAETYEPVAWAEELIEPARDTKHPRLARLYAVAAQCHTTGRVDDAVAYLEASHQASPSAGFDEVPYELQVSTGIVYSHAGQSDRWAEMCRRAIAAGIDGEM